MHYSAHCTIRQTALLHFKFLLRVQFLAVRDIRIQVEVFWVMTPCSVTVVFRHFRGPCADIFRVKCVVQV
jgi:hypothetical protein